MISKVEQHVKCMDQAILLEKLTNNCLYIKTEKIGNIDFESRPITHIYDRMFIVDVLGVNWKAVAELLQKCHVLTYSLHSS